ncbi:MAG TPA: YetF domain-containing protein [Acidobacteriaceae bacterium]|nr:YetF domain-containing protein [Acidobacteriaceae bacterium]
MKEGTSIPKGIATVLQTMFHLQIPLIEKILRPIIVYFFLIFLLRIFGKRELAQLNPFDLVVLLSLGNVVQNALIGNDNSITGGIVGALSLLTINWLVVRFLYSSPKADRLVEGTEQVLVSDGVVDHAALRQELLTENELLAVIHRQGFDGFDSVKKCVLEPNGSFYIEGRTPTEAQDHYQNILNRLEQVQQELQQIRQRLPAG